MIVSALNKLAAWLVALLIMLGLRIRLGGRNARKREDSNRDDT